MARKRVCEFIKKMGSVLGEAELEEMKVKCRKGGVNWRDVIPQIARGILIGDGKMWLSIQASAFHYCSPRLTLDYEMYESFEVAICKGENYWSARALLGEDDKFAKMLDKKYFDGKIFAYVPKQHVEKLYQECKKRFGVLDVE